MHHFYRQLAFATLLACGGAAFAATDAPAEQRVEITAQRDIAMAAAKVVLERRDVRQTFRMSTGRNMEVVSVGDAISMRYGQRVNATLRHDGQGNFVSTDGSLSLQFGLDRDGEPHAARLSLPAERA